MQKSNIHHAKCCVPFYFCSSGRLRFSSVVNKLRWHRLVIVSGWHGCLLTQSWHLNVFYFNVPLPSFGLILSLGFGCAVWTVWIWIVECVSGEDVGFHFTTLTVHFCVQANLWRISEYLASCPATLLSVRLFNYSCLRPVQWFLCKKMSLPMAEPSRKVQGSSHILSICDVCFCFFFFFRFSCCSPNGLSWVVQALYVNNSINEFMYGFLDVEEGYGFLRINAL